MSAKLYSASKMLKLLSSSRSSLGYSVGVRSSVSINHLDESFIIPVSVGSVNCGVKRSLSDVITFFSIRCSTIFKVVFLSISNQKAWSVLAAASIKKRTLRETSLICFAVRFAPADLTVCLNILLIKIIILTLSRVNKFGLFYHFHTKINNKSQIE